MTSLTPRPPTEPSRPPVKRLRRTRVDQLTTLWMILAVVLIGYSVGFHGRIPQEWWTSVHLVTLGVITNAILQWSWYFARALLRLPPDSRQAGVYQVARQVLFNVFLVGLVWAMWLSNWALTIVFAALIGLVIAWHAAALLGAGRGALGARFAIVVRYYGIASAFLFVGIIYAGFVLAAMFAPNAPEWLLEFRSVTTLAHSLLNGLGWVGLTIVGTVITLWPTMLRTRMVPGSEGKAKVALTVLVVAVVGTCVAATLGMLQLAGAAVLVYLGAIVFGVAGPMAQEARQKPPSGYPTWSAAAGFLWSLVGLAWIAVVLFQSPDADSARLGFRPVVALLGVGGILQILVGALTYLMPVVVGGGPRASRVGIAALEKHGGFRLTLRNGGLVLALGSSTIGSPALTGVWVLICLLSFVMDIERLAVAAKAQAKVKRRKPKVLEGQNVE